MSKQKVFIKTFLTVFLCIVSFCFFRIDALADDIDLEEVEIGQRCYLDGFPIVYSNDWLFQIKANEAVVIAYLGDTNNTVEVNHIEIPHTIKMKNDNRRFPVKAIGIGAFSRSNGNFSQVKGIMAGTLVANKYSIWKIKTVTITRNVDTIGKDAFSGNTSITNVAYSNPSLEVIGDGAFYGCTGFTQFTLPETVTTLGSGCFYGCRNLATINIPGKVVNIPDTCFAKCEKLQNIVLHSNVETIGNKAFFECVSFTAITLPDNINSIGASAFENCHNMRTINIPTSLTKINSKTFAHCEILEKVVVPSNVTSIGSYAFAYRVYGREYEFSENAPNLPAVELTEGLKTIDSSAFFDIPGMKMLSIPYSVESIGKEAIGYYESQAGTRPIPGFCIICYSDTAGEDYADDNSFLKTVQTKTDVKMEVNNAGFVTTDKKGEVTLTSITNTSITTFTVPQTIKNGKRTYTVTAIGDGAFSDCKLLKSVTIEAEVEAIGARAFYGCKALETVKIGDKLKSIGKEAFSGCKKLNTLTIGSGLQTIAAKAFYKCKSLEKVTIKSKKIKKIGSKAFSGTSKKGEYSVPAKKLKTYKKKFKKAGTPKTVKFIKLIKSK